MGKLDVFEGVLQHTLVASFARSLLQQGILCLRLLLELRL